MYDELYPIINRYGYPQDWNPACHYDIEIYIEVQIWSDEHIGKYKTYYVQSSVEHLMEHVRLLSDAVTNANTFISKYTNNKNQLSIEDILILIKDSGCMEILKNKIESFRNDMVENNPIQRKSHSIRTRIFSLFIGVNNSLSPKQLSLLTDITLYHDISRKFGANQCLHGIIGAVIFSNIFKEYSILDKQIAMTAIALHSAQDLDTEKLLNRYRCPENNKHLCMLISSILKDADSLDYIRLGIDNYHPNLKLHISKKMINATIELTLLTYRYSKEFIYKICKFMSKVLK